MWASPTHALLPSFSPDPVPLVGESQDPQTHVEERAPTHWPRPSITIKISCKEATASDRVDRFAASSVYQRTEKRLLYTGTCEAFGCDKCVAFQGPTTSLHSRVLQKPRTRRTQTLRTYPCRVVFSESADKQN